MSAVSEWVAREYFEMLGYLVAQPCKYEVPGRQKQADEEFDLIIHNPAVTVHEPPPHLLWESEDLARVSRAIVGVRGWHTERFSVSTFENVPDILRFTEPDSLRVAARSLGTEQMAKILCLPRLPADAAMKRETIRVLKEKGLDGVISFRTMLLELIARVETQRNYEKSDLLQIIRLLKVYHLLSNPQLELFTKSRPPRPRKRPSPAPPAAPAAADPDAPA